MRIQKISYAPTFGYNKRLNKQLNQKLDTAAPDDEMANTIRNLNNYCNSTEELIRTSKDETEEDDFLNAFLSPKYTLMELVDIKYPELNYPKREQKSYLNEVPKNYDPEDIPWQKVAADEFAIFISEDVFSDDEDVQFFINQNSKTEAKPITKSDKTTNVISKIAETPEIVERFQPTFSSPKGFESLGGMHELKGELYDKIIYPATHPEEAKQDFAEYGKRSPRGIMLYGPPGCGKTSIVEALSVESEIPLFKLKVSKAGSSYINQTSKNYEAVFNYVAECAQMLDTPCFLFIDEIDGLAKGRDGEATSEDLKQMSTLLNLIETARDRNVIVLGATNKYDIVDDAIKRRFDAQVYIGMPDDETREEVLKKTLNKWLKGVPLASNPNDLKEIAEKLDGFPTSAIVILADKASDRARKDHRRNIVKEDFYDAIENNQNLKIKEDNYKEERKRTRIGYSRG